MAGAMKLVVGIDDDDPKSVTVGAFAQIAAKRVYGVEAIRDGDPEPILYGVWIELEGVPAKETAAARFDEWLRRVSSFELGAGEEAPDDDEDPTPAESSGSSLVSPQTSE